MFYRHLSELATVAAMSFVSTMALAVTDGGCMQRAGDALPARAHYVDPAEAFNLQEILDRYKIIRLKPAGDYRHAPSLVLRSGDEVYGLIETKLPKITVAGGTTGVVLSGVAPAGLKFESSEAPIHHNCFERIWTADFVDPLTIADTIATDNLFLDIAPGAVRIDTRNRGYLRNNRFIKLEMHSASPSLTVLGSRARPSRGNVFLWLNILTPVADGVIIAGQEEINFIGLDAESWNWNGAARYPAVMNVADSGVVRIFMPHGGDNHGHIGRIFDIDAEEFQLFGLQFGQAGDPALAFHKDTARVSSVMSQTRSIEDQGPRDIRLNLYPDFNPLALFDGLELAQSSLSSAQQRKVVNMFATQDHIAWEPAILPRPVTPDVAPVAQRAQQRDSSAAIQHQIDTQGIAQLPAGVFYVATPLRLHKDQGIIGAGAGATALVAMYPDRDLITSDDHLDRITTIRFALADISLIGGRTGIRHDAAGSGRGAQYNDIVLSHVVFKDMSEAGIVIDTIYGWDNNLIDNVSFVNCDIGIKQVVPSWYHKDDVAGMTYLDKNVFYRTQFLGGRKAIEWPTKRPDNLDMFVASSFTDAAERAVDVANTDSLIFADVDFIRNAGDPQIRNNLPTEFVDTRFTLGSKRTTVLDDHALCEGCTFLGAAHAVARVGRRGVSVLLFNSKSANIPLGDDVNGLLVNSSVPGTLAYRQAIVRVSDGQPTILIPGVPRPSAQLLVSSARE